ncbi:MAG: glycosyltransferase family 39 protein [Acetatifactor sp.]|nr:glycosyltransferase family 39 protein [Acetatifactor sp.]
MSWRWTYLLVVLYSSILVGIVYLFTKLSDVSLQYIIKVALILTISIQLYIVFCMRITPDVDLSHIYEECITMLRSDSIRITNESYFGFYTNNIPLTVIIYWLFRFGTAIGVKDYILLGEIFNVVMLSGSYIVVYKILRRITSFKVTAVTMFILLTNPVFYAYAPYYYTDTLSLIFLLCGTYLILRGYQSEVRWKSRIAFLFAGIVLGMAFQLRVTSLFLPLAVFVCGFIKGKWKFLFEYVMGVSFGFLIFLTIWASVYSKHVSFDTTDSAVTIEHYFMMGSRYPGTYNNEDVYFTKSFSSHSEKVKNNRKMWVARLIQNGVLGNISLALSKERIVWSIGTSGYDQYVRYVTKETRCYDFLVGKEAKYFQAYMQAYRIVILGMLVLGIFIVLLNKAPYMLTLAIYWGGAIIFYIFWEAHPRHSVSFWPLLTMLIIPLLELIEKNMMPSKKCFDKDGKPIITKD